MKDLDKLEKHLKTTAEKQESTPPSFIWDEIDKALPKKKDRKRRFFLWFFFGFSIFGLAIIQQGYFNPQDNTIDGHRSLTEQPAGNSTVEVLKDDKIMNNVSLHKESNQDEKEQVAHKEVTERINNPQDASAFRADIQTQSEFSSKATKQNSLETDHKTISKNKSQSLDKDVTSETNMINIFSEEIINPKEPSPDKSGKFHSIENLKGITLYNSSMRNKVRQHISLLDHMTLEEVSIPNSNSPNSIGKFFFEFSSLIGIHTTHLNNIDTLEPYRINTESNWYTWGVKINLGLRISDFVYVRSGIDFIESRDKFTFEKEFIQLVPATNTMAFSTANGTYFNIGDITYRQWNIPVTIGYEKKRKQFIYGIEGTTLVNFNFKSEGKTQVGPSSFSRVEDQAIYKNRLGLGFSAALMIGINLSENNAIYFKPNYTRYLSNTSVDKSSVKNKLSLYYLEFAYRKSF